MLMDYVLSLCLWRHGFFLSICDHSLFIDHAIILNDWQVFLLAILLSIPSFEDTWFIELARLSHFGLWFWWDIKLLSFQSFVFIVVVIVLIQHICIDVWLTSLLLNVPTTVLKLRLYRIIVTFRKVCVLVLKVLLTVLKTIRKWLDITVSRATICRRSAFCQWTP